MAQSAYNPSFGARPVKRYMQKHVETQIGKMIIKGDINEDTDISIDYIDGELKFLI